MQIHAFVHRFGEEGERNVLRRGSDGRVFFMRQKESFVRTAGHEMVLLNADMFLLREKDCTLRLHRRFAHLWVQGILFLPDLGFQVCIVFCQLRVSRDQVVNY